MSGDWRLPREVNSDRWLLITVDQTLLKFLSLVTSSSITDADEVEAIWGKGSFRCNEVLRAGCHGCGSRMRPDLGDRAEFCIKSAS